MSLRWKSVWITGASAGLGPALALALARQGITVAASARSREVLESLAASAGAHGAGRILPTPLDLADSTAVAAAAEAVIRVFRGPPDLAVLNAGEFGAQDFREQVETSRGDLAKVLDALVPACLAARRGHIALVASIQGASDRSTSAAYYAGRAALMQFAGPLRRKLNRAGVKLQLVTPIFRETPAFDLAAARVIAGLAGRRVAIAFPRGTLWKLKLLRLMPGRASFVSTRPGKGR